MKIIRRSCEVSEQLTHSCPLVSQILASRGILSNEDIETELNALDSFHSLKGIEQASERLYQALLTQESLLVVGDFDADGATSTALAISALKSFGAKRVDYLVPNRFEQGYGLSPAIIDIALPSSPNVIITVDNGIASIEGVEHANQHGIDVIITDHHLSPDTLPKACAIVNPNQPGCEFPSKNIAGVGVIFYVMLALRRKLIDTNYFSDKQIAQPNMASLLDLVALGTVADVVPLDKNNRILVSQGLARIKAGQCRPGITALLKVGKRDPEYLQSFDLGFVVGPRLNAAGRLDDMSQGIACLLASTERQAIQMAETLNDLNIERRQIEESMKQEAFTIINQLKLTDEKMPLGICLFEDSWHQGVIGIVAGRLKEKFHRPAIVFAAGDDGKIKGSARSIEGVHIRDILDEVSKKAPDVIDAFGGHAMAAGLTLPLKQLPLFKQTFLDVLANHLTEEECVGTLYTDGELALEYFNLDTARLLADIAPWGQQFPRPVFDNTFTLVEQRLLAGKHLKMTLQPEHSNEYLDAIAFNVSNQAWPNYRASKVHCAFYLDENRYQGRSRLQLMVETIDVVD